MIKLFTSKHTRKKMKPNKPSTCTCKDIIFYVLLRISSYVFFVPSFVPLYIFLYLKYTKIIRKYKPFLNLPLHVYPPLHFFLRDLLRDLSCKKSQSYIHIFLFIFAFISVLNTLILQNLLFLWRQRAYQIS